MKGSQARLASTESAGDDFCPATGVETSVFIFVARKGIKGEGKQFTCNELKSSLGTGRRENRSSRCIGCTVIKQGFEIWRYLMRRCRVRSMQAHDLLTSFWLRNASKVGSLVPLMWINVNFFCDFCKIVSLYFEAGLAIPFTTIFCILGYVTAFKENNIKYEYYYQKVQNKITWLLSFCKDKLGLPTLRT